jgi:hypothetical protein
VGLFSRTPKQLKQLDMDIMAARMALSMGSALSPDHRARVVQTAPGEVAGAAAAAASAGHLQAAREMLEEAARKPPSDPVGAEHWPSVINEGLRALGIEPASSS